LVLLGGQGRRNPVVESAGPCKMKSIRNAGGCRQSFFAKLKSMLLNVFEVVPSMKSLSRLYAYIPALIAGVEPFYNVAVFGIVAAASVTHALAVDFICPAGQLSRIEFVEIVDSLHILAFEGRIRVEFHMDFFLARHSLQNIENALAFGEFHFLCRIDPAVLGQLLHYRGIDLVQIVKDCTTVNRKGAF
jgi:hypothetical protein